MPPESSIASHHFESLGTSCSVFAVGQSHELLIEAEFWVRRLGARLTRFSADSELSRLNRDTGDWVPISAELQAIIRAAFRADEMSAGLVNVAVLPSMHAVGYTRPFTEGPGVATLEDLSPLPPLADVLELREGEARLQAGCGVDLGGIAKGWMADRLSATLGADVLVNLGGDLFARGSGPRGDGWPVGLGGSTLLLRDQGAATSSGRRRRWGEMHHLIDPRTGLPAKTGLEEVSVVAASGFEAEVVAKTALLLGPDLAPAYCAAHAMAWWLSDGHDD